MALQTKERNKLIFAVALLGVAAFALYYSFSQPVVPPPAAAPAAKPKPLAAVGNPMLPSAQRRAAGRAAKAPSGPIDPKLQLDLLGKSAGITYEPGGGRNIFSYGAPPPPQPPPNPVKNPVIGPGASTGASVGTMPPQIAPAPPIPLRYFGYASKPNDPVKKVFLAQDEASDTDRKIFIAGEGEIVNKRYRILKIGVNTVEVEDMVTKSRQVLPLQESHG